MDISVLSALAFNYYDLGESLDIKLALNKTTEHIYTLTNPYKDIGQSSWFGLDLIFPSQPTTTLAISLTSFLIYRLILFIVGIEGVLRLHRKYDLSRHRRDADNISDIDICLEPIGFGFFQTFDYYKDLPGLGVCILLTVEMVRSSNYTNYAIISSYKDNQSSIKINQNLLSVHLVVEHSPTDNSRLDSIHGWIPRDHNRPD